MAGLLKHLDKLCYFSAIADCGSISQAAKKLKITQPTLSFALRSLENALGAKLVSRSSRGVTLTWEGELLSHFAEELSRKARRVEQKINPSRRQRLLRLGAKEPWAVAHWYTRNREGAAKLRLSNSNKELLHLLRSDEIDVAILPDPPSSGDLICFDIGEDCLRFFCARHLKANPKRLRTLPLIIFQRSYALREPRLKSRATRDVDSYTVAKELALAGQGIALLPKSYALKGAGTESLFEIPLVEPDRLPSYRNALCAIEGRIPNATLRAFAKSLRESPGDRLIP